MKNYSIKLPLLFTICIILMMSCSKNEVSTPVIPPIINVTDIDGNIYPVVTIGTQVWTQKNLNVTKYRNGDIIPKLTSYDQTAWVATTKGAWCFFENDNQNSSIYGRLYNWYAVNDPRGLAPIGYHIPTEAEWNTLKTFLGGADIAGGKMKSTTGWSAPNTGASNSSGFTGLPGGYRLGSDLLYNIGDNGYWWSSTEYNITTGYYHYLNYNYGWAYRNFINKNEGFSVRLIKD